MDLTPGGCSTRAEEAELRLLGPAPMALGPGGAERRFTLRAGEVRWLLLTLRREDAPPPAHVADRAEAALRSTLDSWERWSARRHFPAPYSHELRRSALPLKRLIRFATESALSGFRHAATPARRVLLSGGRSRRRQAAPPRQFPECGKNKKGRLLAQPALFVFGADTQI